MNKNLKREKEERFILYSVNNKAHRENGPAVVCFSGVLYWYKDGKLHRENGPAIIWDDGEMEWFLNGERIDK